MGLLIFNTSNDPIDIFNQIIDSTDRDIILYHDQRSDTIPSIEQPEVCSFYARLCAIMAHDESEIAFSKLHIQSINEMFICDYANRIYQNLDVDDEFLNLGQGIPYGDTGLSVLDIINNKIISDDTKSGQS